MSRFKLRPYQTEAAQQCSVALKVIKRVLLVLPTGAGKTVTFSEIVRRVISRNKTVLVLTDRIELFEQTFSALEGHLVEASGEDNFFNAVNFVNMQVLHAKSKMANFNPQAKVTVAMVETIKRRLLVDFEPDLIIIDEAHKGNFTKVIERFPDAMVIGATASPVGKHLFELYGRIVQNIDIPELIEQGYLVPCQSFQMQDDLSDLEVDSTGDYSEKSQWEHYGKSKMYKGVIDEWRAKAEGLKTIVFNVNIEHAEQMNQEFVDSGISSACITSETPKHERERILDDFKKGRILVLNNCGILTTGYDEPTIGCVIVNRATKSLALWLQMNGRGSRPVYAPGFDLQILEQRFAAIRAGGKEKFICLDFGMNHKEHKGPWQQARHWELKPPRKSAERAAATKVCPKCEAMVYASVSKCAHCGFDGWGMDKGERELHTGVMVEVKAKPTVPPELVGKRLSECDMRDLAILQKSKRYSAAFVWLVVRSKGEPGINEYAGIMQYKPNWAKKQLETAQDPQQCVFSDFTLQ